MVTTGSPFLRKEQILARFADAQARLVQQINAAGCNVLVRQPTAKQFDSVTTERGLEALVRVCTRVI